jgi:hypothetical protein
MSDNEDERRAALVSFVRVLELDPLPGDGEVRIGRTKSKSDAPYFTTSGVIAESARAAALRRVGAALELVGWDFMLVG